uniref:Uncharacterized protein MANES_13G054700 n=1 Tax=Rhizophora mucronata TaxID=61149 RepID=A0A2P2J9N6_RHIMU
MASILAVPATTAIIAAPRLWVFSKTPPAHVSLPSSLACSSVTLRRNGRKNGALSTFACSTSQFIGRVGLQRREGNASILYFGFNPNAAEVAKSDSSQVLSAMLPFVVAATAVAALAQPATFTWSVW